MVAAEAGGRLRLMGTPAEEGGGGKIAMGRNGCVRRPRRGDDGPPGRRRPDPDGRDRRSRSCDVRYEGRAAHAAAAPQEGRNALDAAVLGYMNVAALRQHILPTERIHGVFVKGGDKPNIVPAEAVTTWMVRSANIASLQPLKQRVLQCLEASALGDGLHVHAPRGPATPTRT